MSRAQGKHTSRTPTIEPATPEGDEIGLSARMVADPSPIPGDDTHLINPETMRQKVVIPDPKPEFRGMMAHGVPPESHTARERAEFMRGPNTTRGPAPRYESSRKRPTPIPVYIAEPAEGGRPLNTMAGKRITIPANTSDPVRIAARDLTRIQILLLVETAAGPGNSPVPTTPAVPASTVAQQNANTYPVLVTITGGTLTVVSVNGTTVGTTDGTYLVPAAGTIAITYSVAPIWTWANANPTTAAPTGIRFAHEISDLAVGESGATAGGTLLRAGAGSYLRIICNDELFAVSNDGSAVTLSVIYLYGVAGAG